MKTITHNGMTLSKLCLGTASMGMYGLSGEPLEKAFAVLDCYYAMGGRFLDTANIYGRWDRNNNLNASEHCIGMWLRTRGITDVTITSKCCHYMNGAYEISRVNRECAFTDLEDSRQSLGIDTIPVYLLHRDNRECDIRRIVDFCVEMVESGKIGKFGFSNFRLDRIRTAMEYLGADRKQYFAGVSNEWSLAMEGAGVYQPDYGMEAMTAETAQYCADNDILLIPFSAVAHGWFDKLAKDGVSVIPASDGTYAFRGTGTYKPEWMTAANAQNYANLRALHEKTGSSMTALSAAYLAGKAQPVIPVVSVSRVEQLEDYASALDQVVDGLGTW